jgi:hypothetical protein
MKKITSSLLFCLVSLFAFSQSTYTISGKIIDETTKLPLQGASVFAENTTIGTATDREGIFHLRLPNGGYSIVITFTGYQTETKRVTTADAGNSGIVVEIKQKEKSMDEFVVKATYEVADGLEKYGGFFLDNFIGKTANSKLCVIKNKEALKFYYYRRTNRLKILATAPLEIVNDAMGYTIKYELDSFVHEYNSQVSLYTGYPLFQEMESSSLDQLLKWNAARKVAYNGSILHFMRSMYQKRLKEEGFEIQFVVKRNDKETALTIKDFYSSVNYSRDDSSNTVEILPKQKEVAIIYKNEESSPLYAEANPEASTKFQLSVVSFLPNESLDIEQNGFYYEQNDITITGYWAWEKVGDMLPYDFKERTTTVPARDITVKPSVPVNNNPVQIKTEQPEPAITPIKPVTEPVNTGTPLLPGINWRMDESRVIDGNNMYYYKRGGQENTINFDEDSYKFGSDNTGIYFYNGQEYKFNWKYLDAEKTKMEMIILYPTPLIVHLENISLTATSFKYTRLQKVNGVNYVAIESRTAN